MNTASPPSNNALVELTGVSVVFGGKVRALDDVTLTITRGDIVGLVGESGSGKTTLCRAIVGLTPASSGEVRLNGASVAAQLAANPLAFRRQVQMLLQDAVASLSPQRPVAGCRRSSSVSGCRPMCWPSTRTRSPAARRVGLAWRGPW